MNNKKELIEYLESARYSLFEAIEKAQRIFGIDSDQEKLIQVTRKEVTNLINAFKEQ